MSAAMRQVIDANAIAEASNPLEARHKHVQARRFAAEPAPHSAFAALSMGIYEERIEMAHEHLSKMLAAGRAVLTALEGIPGPLSGDIADVVVQSVGDIEDAQGALRRYECVSADEYRGR